MVAALEERLDRTLTALADPTRRAILRQLSRGETRVTDIARPFEISLNSVSKHIRVLERANLVTRRRSGREHWLAFNRQPLDEAAAWIEAQRAFWNDRLDALELALNKAEAEQAMSNHETATVQVTHRYVHPPERVFDAWLNPDLARRFLFATPTGEIVRCDIDPVVGGKFVITDRRDGQDAEHTGEYREIDPPRRLVFTFGVPAYSSEMSLVTIEIAPVEGGCELTLTTELKREWADRTREGWGKILQGLEQAVAG